MKIVTVTRCEWKVFHEFFVDFHPPISKCVPLAKIIFWEKLVAII